MAQQNTLTNLPDPNSDYDWGDWAPNPDNYSNFETFKIDWDKWADLASIYDPDSGCEEELSNYSAKEAWDAHFEESNA